MTRWQEGRLANLPLFESQEVIAGAKKPEAEGAAAGTDA